MTRILFGLGPAKTTIYDESSRKRICPCVAWGSSSASGRGSSGSFGHRKVQSVAAISQPRKFSSVISDCERRANFHGPLRSVGFFRRFGLFKKVNSRFVAVVGDEIRRFFETHPAQRAACIHVPLA